MFRGHKLNSFWKWYPESNVKNQNKNKSADNERLMSSMSQLSLCKNEFKLINGNKRAHQKVRPNKSVTFETKNKPLKPYHLSRKLKLSKEIMVRRQDPFLSLRSFNNWCKSYLMQRTFDEHVDYDEEVIGVDLCCSKGVDLIKWHHCKIDFLYLVEPDKENMKECEVRYKTLYETHPYCYDVDFLIQNFTEEDIKIYHSADIVSCQLYFQRAFESEKKLKTAAKNISGSLKLGGLFIASFTNVNEIKKRMSENKNVIGNSVYEINFSNRPDFDSRDNFGCKFQFSIGENVFQEYLVNFDVLQKVMAEHGMILKRRQSFLDLYLEGRMNVKQVHCMRKMDVLRYQVNEFGKQKLYLTLSPEEEEAASFYDTATFIKINK